MATVEQALCQNQPLESSLNGSLARSLSGMATAALATGGYRWLGFSTLAEAPWLCLTFDREWGAVPCLGQHALVQHVQY
jgi:hypothetical protein